MQQYLASPGAYEPPLLPWANNMAGKGFIFRSRMAQAAPYLLAELQFLGDVLQQTCGQPAEVRTACNLLAWLSVSMRMDA